jgi:hypothetical protein
MKIFNTFTWIFSLLCIHTACYGTIFDIENVRIGPNPLVQGKDHLIINYVASRPHRAEYFVYSVTGELILTKKFDHNIPSITHAGECQLILLDKLAMSQVPKQLYVVIIVFDSGTEKIKKKTYVIVK